MPIENSLLKIQYISRSLVYHQSLHFTSGEITITHFIISEKEMLVWSKTDVKQFWVCPATDDVTDCEAKNEADQQHCIHSFIQEHCYDFSSYLLFFFDSETH